MLSYTLKRLLFAFPSLLGVLTVVFFIVRVAPGDPAIVILGESASAAALSVLREQLGLTSRFSSSISSSWARCCAAISGAR